MFYFGLHGRVTVLSFFKSKSFLLIEILFIILIVSFVVIGEYLRGSTVLVLD